MLTKVGSASDSEKPLEFPAKLEHLYEMLAYIKNSALIHGFTKTTVSKIELAAEEALVNIIVHGFPGKQGIIHITCEKHQEEHLSITIKDNGLEFNPLKAAQVFDPSSETNEEMVDHPKVGGYGIYFIVNMMDNVDYQYFEGKNILKLIKRIS